VPHRDGEIANITAVTIAILAGLLGLAPPTSPVELRPGFVMLSPVGVAVPRLGSTADTRIARQALGPSYGWGFAAGINLQPVPGLLLGFAGSFDQVIWSVRDYRPGDELGAGEREQVLCFAGDCYGWNERVVGSLLRLGLDLRIGWVGRRVLVWALVSPHVGVSRLRLECNDARDLHCDRKHTDVGPGLGGGLGSAFRFVDYFALGIEANIDHEWLDDFDDPFEAVRTWQVGLVALFSF
jgi:hypothetical protein